MSTDQAQAILFGVALGDALGRPVEFSSHGAIVAAYGPAGIQEPPSPALYTDDTQMTLALTEGLLDAGIAAPIDAQMQAVGRRFIAWSQHADTPGRAPGTTCLSGVAALRGGADWRESGVAGSKGCGAAMRVATLGYLYRHDEARLREVAHMSGILTHGHPASVAATLAAAWLVKLALDGVPPAMYIERTLAFVRAHELEHVPGWQARAWQPNGDFEAAMGRLVEVLTWDDEVAAMPRIGEGWVGDEAVAMALFAVLRHPDDYAAAVRTGANITGDSDSVASIAGGIVAARLGVESIPRSWVDRCENREALANLAGRMHAAVHATGTG
jgi:ADP-ribosylglycohydrolase